MQKPTPKEPALHGASAESDPDAKPAKTAPKPATAKPVEPNPTIAIGEAESHTRSC